MTSTFLAFSLSAPGNLRGSMRAASPRPAGDYSDVAFQQREGGRALQEKSRAGRRLPRESIRATTLRQVKHFVLPAFKSLTW